MKEFQERLLKIEARSNIFELEVKGIRLWQYVRWFCLVEIWHDVTGEGQAHIVSKIVKQKGSNSLKEKIKRQQFLLKKKDMIVINHPRRVKVGKYYRCFVTESLLENLDYTYYVFEKDFRGQHFVPAPTKNLKYINMDNMEKIFKAKNDETDRQLKYFFNKVIEIFERDERVNLSRKAKQEILNYIINGYYEIREWTFWAKIVFTLVRPKILIVTSPFSPNVEAVVAEAKRRHITTIEMQHGIAPGHFFYNYLYQGEIEIFSDYMFVYSKYDREAQRYPIGKRRIIPVGYPALEERAKECRRTEANSQKNILFISSFEDTILDYAVKLSEDQRLKGMKVIYKLHPYEYGIWRENLQYQQLIKNGVEIISENKHDIYYYMGQADYVIGNVSTALFEATEFDVQIFIIKGGNYKDSEMLYENGYARLVTSADMLADEILNPSPFVRNKKNYFEKNAIENMKRELDRIMTENDKERKRKYGYKRKNTRHNQRSDK